MAFLTLYAWAKYSRECREAWRDHFWVSLLIGLFSMANYLLILYALRRANVSYVAALREVSVVMVAALGVMLLGESMGWRKALALAAILAGALLVDLA